MIENQKEIEGLTRILQKLSSNDLEDLVLNVTNHLIKSFKIEEAIFLILKYSKDAFNLLKKKKIKKEILFNYLRENEIYINAQISKKNIVLKCLEYWGLNKNDIADLNLNERMEDEDVQFIEIDSSSSQKTTDFKQTDSSTVFDSNDYQNIIQYKDIEDNFNENNINDELIKVSLQFGKYFYSILPFIHDDNIFSVKNFWQDANLKLMIKCQNNNTGLCLNEIGHHSIVNCLRRITLKGRVQFKPNLLPQYNGIRAVMENHGLLKIIVSGSVHFDDNPIGIFDHLFGLISDSSINKSNWRIKIFESILNLTIMPPIEINNFLE